MTDQASVLERATLSVPRPAGRLVSSALRLYWCFPLLFLTLGAIVIVPFDLIILAASGKGPYLVDARSVGGWLVQVGYSAWIIPLISALHIYAVVAIRRGETPRLHSVAAAGFRMLPTVIPPTLASGLLIGLGFIGPSISGLPPGFVVLLVLPGLVLLLRFSVVAQVASIERSRWLRPLARSWELTARQWGHVLGFLLLAGLVTLPLLLAMTIPLRHHATTPATFIAGILAHILFASFSALATALLYFDLRAHKETAASVAATSPEAA